MQCPGNVIGNECVLMSFIEVEIRVGIVLVAVAHCHLICLSKNTTNTVIPLETFATEKKIKALQIHLFVTRWRCSPSSLLHTV